MIIRWGIKLGLAGGAVYYFSEQGLWKDGAHSVELYEKINAAAKPYIQQLKSNLPFEIPELPSSQKFSYVGSHYWNKGVMWTFEQLANLPNNVGKWTNKGIENVKSNPEMKKVFDSFSVSESKQ